MTTDTPAPLTPDPDLTARVIALADAEGAGDDPHPVGLAGMSLVRARAPTPLVSTLYQPLVCLVLQGAKETSLGAAPVLFSAGQTLVVSLDMPAVSRIVDASRRAPYVALALPLDLTLTRSLTDEIDAADEAAEDAAPGAAIAAGDADADLASAMGRLFDLAARSEAERRVMTPLLVREVHFRVLTARHGAMLRRLADRAGGESRVARAITLIRRDFARQIAVPELAAAAGMSPSSFHAHFKAATATTPLQYQKDLRLFEARRLLCEERRAVSAVAFAVGYESPSQFSREYARKFGAPPSRDAAEARAPGPAAPQTISA